jgi:hypothetical protein
MDIVDDDACTWQMCGTGTHTRTHTEAHTEIETSDNLWTAASNGDIERVLVLLTQDPLLVNAKDENGYSAL